MVSRKGHGTYHNSAGWNGGNIFGCSIVNKKALDILSWDMPYWMYARPENPTIEIPISSYSSRDVQAGWRDFSLEEDEMPTGVYVRTEENNRRNSERQRGRKHSEATKRKISESNKGKVHSRKSLRYVINENGCHVCVSHKPNSDGYIYLGRNGKLLRAHRMEWEKYYGSIPESLCVLHVCDNPACINVEHLFLGTTAENSKDMVRKGRSARGERHGSSKLTEKDIFQIRELLREGILQKEMAKTFDVTDTTISDIKLGKSWAWLMV